jgi:hypothetical protein
MKLAITYEGVLVGVGGLLELAISVKLSVTIRANLDTTLTQTHQLQPPSSRLAR